MTDQFARTKMLLGEEAVRRVNEAHVAVFGLGGVGGYAVEALARAGVGQLTLVDHDTVSVTNINRQILATHSTVGQKKTDAALGRIRDIYPACRVHIRDAFFSAENADTFDFTAYDYVIDAIDSVASKLLLAEICHNSHVPLIASMGTGNQTDGSRFIVSDITKTSGCPLARVMRRELKNRGIPHLTVVYTPLEPKKPVFSCEEETGRRSTPGTVPFVPPMAGFLLAGHVLNALWQEDKK